MLAHLKRWFGRRNPGPAEAPMEAAGLREWADRRGVDLRPVKGGGGCVVDGRMGSAPWRLEWGPPQRPYVNVAELRLRADVAVPADWQALVLNRRLQEAMERQLFEQYVESVKTQIDDQTPPEMRWLVMFQKLGSDELGPLRERFAAVSNQRPWLLTWLQGALGPALLHAARVQSLTPEHPLVLTVSRSRLTLRTQSTAPEAAELDAWLKLFECAWREVARAAPGGADAAAAASDTGGSGKGNHKDSDKDNSPDGDAGGSGDGGGGDA
jgi:hypothetical protein